MYSLFKMGIFYCHVCLLEGSSKTKLRNSDFKSNISLTLMSKKRVGDQNKRLENIGLVQSDGFYVAFIFSTLGFNIIWYISRF